MHPVYGRGAFYGLDALEVDWTFCGIVMKFKGVLTFGKIVMKSGEAGDMRLDFWGKFGIMRL